MASRIKTLICIAVSTLLHPGSCRDEDRIMKACYWPNELYEPCFGGCAEVSCDNPRNHLRPCYPYCEPGCVCEDPYVRDDRTHMCVLPQDCSPTQMGIPVPTRRSERYNTNTNANTNTNTNINTNTNTNNNISLNTKRHFVKKEDEFQETRDDVTSVNQVSNPRGKFPSDMARMGNYFNIVIAPPPIRALQPRKTQGDSRRTMPKRVL